MRVDAVGPEAAELMHRLMIAAFEEYRAWLQPPTGALAETVADVAAGLAAGGGAIAWIEDVPAGAVRFDYAANHLYVGRLAVPPEHRGKGVAGALMAEAERRAAALGLPVVRVEVRSALPGNIAMFERLGFKQVAVLPHPKMPSETTVTLDKTVS